MKANGGLSLTVWVVSVAVLPRDEIDMDDVDSKAEDHVGEAGIRPRDERKNGSAAASGVAFPAERWEV
jgi:hypothetical protein